jgi:Xaa-Pro dipeptidase
MSAIAKSLIAAQMKAEALFSEVVGSGMIPAGKLESELTEEIHELAYSKFNLRRHWHKRIARSGPNILLTYYDKELYQRTPSLTAGELYDFVAGLAAPAGWEFGALTAGHLIGHFPRERASTDTKRSSIRHGNDQSLREPDPSGKPRHWILEIHFVDRDQEIGGFYEELLTVDENQTQRQYGVNPR